MLSSLLIKSRKLVIQLSAVLGLAAPILCFASTAQAYTELVEPLADFEEIIRTCELFPPTYSVDASVGDGDVLTLTDSISGGSIVQIATIPLRRISSIGFAGGIVFRCERPGCIRYINRSRDPGLTTNDIQNRNVSRYTFSACARRDLIQAYRLLQFYMQERQ